MIKPESLWGLFKTCEDSKWLGDICRALGRQEVELDYGQRMMLATIRQDSGWMDERIEDQRARWVDRQRKSRANKRSHDVTPCHGDTCDTNDVTQCHGDIRDTHDVTIHPSIHPSIHPTIHKEEESVSPARTRVKIVTWEMVKAHITGPSVAVRIPEAFARSWFDKCEFIGWTDMKGNDISRNWKNKLVLEWRDDEKAQRERNGGKTDSEAKRDKAKEDEAFERWNRRRLSEEDDD